LVAAAIWMRPYKLRRKIKKKCVLQCFSKTLTFEKICEGVVVIPVTSSCVVCGGIGRKKTFLSPSEIRISVRSSSNATLATSSISSTKLHRSYEKRILVSAINGVSLLPSLVGVNKLRKVKGHYSVSKHLKYLKLLKLPLKNGTAKLLFRLFQPLYRPLVLYLYLESVCDEMLKFTTLVSESNKETFVRISRVVWQFKYKCTKIIIGSRLRAGGSGSGCNGIKVSQKQYLIVFPLFGSRREQWSGRRRGCGHGHGRGTEYEVLNKSAGTTPRPHTNASQRPKHHVLRLRLPQDLRLQQHLRRKLRWLKQDRPRSQIINVIDFSDIVNVFYYFYYSCYSHYCVNVNHRITINIAKTKLVMTIVNCPYGKLDRCFLLHRSLLYRLLYIFRLEYRIDDIKIYRTSGSFVQSISFQALSVF